MVFLPAEFLASMMQELSSVENSGCDGNHDLIDSSATNTNVPDMPATTTRDA